MRWKMNRAAMKTVFVLVLVVLVAGCVTEREKPNEIPGHVTGPLPEKVEGTTMTCGEYCEEHVDMDCQGYWNISGIYPECTCNYVCSSAGANATEEGQGGTGHESKEVTLGPQTEWPTFHGDAARTGFSVSEAPAKSQIIWEWGGSGVSDTNWPVIENNTVFVAADRVVALELETGKELWSYVDESQGFYPRGIAVGNGNVFVTVNSEDALNDLPPGHIYALDRKTGKLIWKYRTEGGISHSLPLLAEGNIFVGDDSGTVYSITADGELSWKRQLDDAEVIHSSPAYYKGSVFVGTEGTGMSNAMPSRMYALDAKTGDEIWRFEIDYINGKLNLIHSTPAVSENVVYFGSENGYFYAVSSDEGKLIWKRLIASGSDRLVGVSAAAAIGYGKVFIGTYEGKFMAISQETGKVVWDYDFGKANADSSPLLADGKVYFGSGEGGDGYFYCFDADSGEVMWKVKLGGASPALASGVLVVPNMLENGSEHGSPAIVAFFDYR